MSEDGFGRANTFKEQVVLLACSCMLVTTLTEQQGCRGPRVARTNKTQDDRCNETPCGTLSLGTKWESRGGVLT